MGRIVTGRVDTSQRLAVLRKLMKEETPPIDAFVVPSEDAHFSEYPSHSDERRAFISGFTGSAGCAVVTHDGAYLFTDGRYFLQASQQLDENWTLMKQGLPDVPSWQEFLSKNLENKKIGVDPTLVTADDAKKLKPSLAAKDSEFVYVDKNPVDIVWGKDRPARTKNKVFPLDVKYAGHSSEEKIEDLRKQLVKKKVVGTVVNMLDEVAWLFNLRGTDVDYNPVFYAYAVVTHDNVVLFIDSEQLGDDAKKHLGDAVEVKPYEEIFNYLRGLQASAAVSKDKPLLLGNTASLALALAAGLDNITLQPSLVSDAKSIKNATEIEGFRQCHIRDGAALAQYFSWLEEQLDNGVVLTESQGSDKLEEYRSQLDLFRGLSFCTISSTGPNAAIVHYSPDPVSSAVIKKDQIYLCDSGGQYWDGTTDVTRTLHFGTPTEEEKRAFTRVLQGHIAIDQMVFPTGTTGYIMLRHYGRLTNSDNGDYLSSDSIARLPLWKDGLDYRHGTGHGVGHYLNVHEGPQGIGTRLTLNKAPLKTGMTLSNEPGYYHDGHFGIRIENIVIVREANTPNNFGNKGYLGFEHVTLCPIQTKLILLDLLAASEKEWINAYHEETWTKVSPLLERFNDKRALDWLKRECSPI